MIINLPVPPEISTGAKYFEDKRAILPYVSKDGRVFAVFEAGQANEAKLYAERLRQVYKQPVFKHEVSERLDKIEQQIQDLRQEIIMLTGYRPDL